MRTNKKHIALALLCACIMSCTSKSPLLEESTIDANLQDIVESQLRQKLSDKDAEWGCVVLMEVKTGEVKAICNLGRNEDGSYSEMKNYAVERVEPGSIFKTVSLMAALDDGKVTLQDTFLTSSKGWTYNGATHTDAHKMDGYLTVQQALAVSSNIVLAKIVTESYDKKADKFVKKLDDMGVREPFPCDIPGAQDPRIDVPRDAVTLSKMAYGYSVELSPLQTLMFYNAIANNGKMIAPVFVKQVRKDGRPVKTVSAKTIKSSICKKSTLRDIRKALHDVVWDNEYGTASVSPWGQRKAQSDLVHIAGKTGTVQLFEHGRYDNRLHRISFVGYFPEEAPEYTCICVIQRPHGGYDAGTDCGATVRRIAERIMKQKCSSQTTPAWVQELKEKNPLKDKRNYTCVYFKYDTIVDNFEVKGMFFPSYIDGWFYESGVCMYLRNVVTGEEYEFTDYTSDCNAFKSIFMSKNVYDIIEDSAFTGFKDGDYYIFKYHNEHDTHLCQDSNERVIYPLKSQAEFQLFDVDFDGENELLISYYQGGPYQSTIYDVYELRGKSLTKRSLEINSTSVFDAKQKTMSTTVSDGNSQTSYYVYESPEKGTMNLKWHIIQRANYDNDTIIRDTIFGNM